MPCSRSSPLDKIFQDDEGAQKTQIAVDEIGRPGPGRDPTPYFGGALFSCDHASRLGSAVLGIFQNQS